MGLSCGDLKKSYVSDMQVETEISKRQNDRFTTSKVILDLVCMGLQGNLHIKDSVTMSEVINHLRLMLNVSRVCMFLLWMKRDMMSLTNFRQSGLRQLTPP